MRLGCGPMRRALLPLALCLALAPLALGAQDTRYFDALPDLPVMPGLEQAEAAGVAFDKPGGRILTLYAVGQADPAVVAAFYRESLPALGWDPAGAEAWTRGDERLRLELDRLGMETVARFTLAPR